MKRSESGIYAHRDINAEDPHLQYLRIDGYRPMQGDLDLDGNDILNVGLIGAVDLENHASRHESGGADPIDGYQISLNYSPVNYSVLNALIGDHIAAIDYIIGTFSSGGVPGGRILTAGNGLTGGGDLTADRTFDVVANADGSITVNADDIQVGVLATDGQHGNRGGGNLHSLADSVNAGFLSADGYNKLQDIDLDGYVESVFGRTGNVVQQDSDYNSDQIDNFSGVPGLTVSDALEYLDGYVGDYLPLDGSVSMSGSINMAGFGITNSPVGGDLSGNLPNPNVVDLTITGEDHGDLLFFDGYNWVRLPAGDDGYLLQTNGANNDPSWTAVETQKTKLIYELVLTEDIYNTTAYFHAFRSAGGDTSDPKRSGNSSGISFQNACSPIQIPFDCTVIEAILTLRGAGVQNGSVTYPVTFETELRRQDFASDSLIDNIDFSISNLYTVGTYSVANTNFTGSVDLNIDLDKGWLVGLKFINGTGASLVGQTRNAFITLIVQER